ncbi:MAG: SDR family oxidoreductase [Polyangiaceae bacterium]
MRAVVTGARGLVGQRLVRVLAARGHEVVAWSRADVELSDSRSVEAALGKAKADIVFNPASMTEVDKCEADKTRAYRDNVLAAANLGIATNASRAHLVHVSTDYVFDGHAGPYREEDAPNPRGVYAKTKRMGEVMIEELAGSFCICRTAVVYGWPEAARPNFGAWLYGVLSQGKEAKLFSDQFVSPTLADSLAEMLVEIGERKLTGMWNVSGADVVSRVDFGHAFCDAFGFDRKLVLPTKIADMNFASPRPLHSGLRVDKIRNTLQNKPLSTHEAIERFKQAVRGAPAPAL